MASKPTSPGPRRSWRTLFERKSEESLKQDGMDEKQPKATWTMGILNDRETIEVPGKYSSSATQDGPGPADTVFRIGSVALKGT
jgi:hypothetical protein